MPRAHKDRDLSTKLEILRKLQSGQKSADLAREYNVSAANRAASCRFVHRCTQKMLKRLLLRSLRLQAPLHPKTARNTPCKIPIT